jgi:hypothetical protein
MNNELEGTWKETFVIQAAFLEDESETTGGCCPDEDPIRAPPKYKSGTLMLE